MKMSRWLVFRDNWQGCLRIWLFFSVSCLSNCLLICPVASQNPYHDSIRTILPKLEGSEKVLFLNRMVIGLWWSDSVLAKKMALDGLQLANEINDTSGMAMSNFALGKLSYLSNELEASKYYFELGLEFSSKINDIKLSAILLQNIAHIHELHGFYDKSLLLLLKALSINEQVGEPMKIASNFLNLSNIYRMTGKFDSAFICNNKSLSIYNKINDLAGKSMVYNNFGNIYYYLGSYDSAVQYYLKSLDIKVLLDDKIGQSKTLNNIASIYYQNSNFEYALDYYRRSLDLLSNFNNELFTAIGYGNIGLVFNGMEIFDSAMFYYTGALELYEKNKNLKGIASTTTNIGLLQTDKGQYNEALINLNKALVLNQSMNDEAETALTLQHISGVYLLLNLPDEALKHGRQSLEICEKLGLQKQKMDNYKLLSNIYKKKEMYAQAYQSLVQYLVLHDSIFNNEQRDKINRIIEKFEREAKERTINLLTAEKGIVELKAQRNKIIAYSILFAFTLTAVITWLMFNRFKIKRNQRQLALELKSVEIESRLVQSQINPHAISNVLHNINSLILQQNFDEASLRLQQFERFMQKMLESSRRSFSSLQSEIELLESYLKIESSYKQRKLNYFINIDPNIIPDEIELPSMLLQPFVENSIKHGIHPLHKEGIVQMSFSKLNDVLICTIEDNGIGRKAAEELHNKKQALRPSLGNILVKERIELLQKLEGIQITLNIIDLYDENGNAAGTKVVIEIPLDE